MRPCSDLDSNLNPNAVVILPVSPASLAQSAIDCAVPAFAFVFPRIFVRLFVRRPIGPVFGHRLLDSGTVPTISTLSMRCPSVLRFTARGVPGYPHHDCGRRFSPIASTIWMPAPSSVFGAHLASRRAGGNVECNVT